MLLSVFLIPQSFAVTTGDEANVDILNTKNEPDPVSPGRYFDAWFKIQNTGNTKATNVSVEFVPKYPFSIDATENAVRQIGILGTYEDAVIKYRVRVDDNAIEGTNTIDLKYKVGDAIGAFFTKSFDIEVLTKEAKLDVESVYADEISPGKTGEVKISIKNNGASRIEDISIKLDTSSQTTPFSPIESITEKRAGNLAPGETSTLVFKLMATPGAKSDLYKIPVTITYSDIIGNAYNKSSIISVIISSTPAISVGIDETDIIQAGQNGKIILNIVNRGLINLKFLEVSISPGTERGYTLLSAGTIYIGNIDSDDYDTAEFKMHVDPSLKNKTLDIPVQIEYVDANNRQYKENRIVTLNLYTTEEAETFNLVPSSGSGTIWAVIIIAVLAYGAYRYVKRGKKE